MAESIIAVTGSIGALGGRVAARLAKRGVRQRLIVRDPAKAPQLAAEIAIASSYTDSDAMIAALAGCETLFFVSARESAQRVAEHKSVVDAAVTAGVRRIVYTSFLHAWPNATFTLARDHYATEQYVAISGLDYTFLQDSLYLDFMPLMTSDAGVIAGPAGNGTFAPVARDDVADVAALVLATPNEYDGRTLQLTGPETITFARVAEELSRVTGRSITYKNETIEEAYAARASYGAPKFEVDGWVTSYLAIAAGELNVVTDTIPTILNRPATSLTEWLASNPESYARLLLP